MKKYLFFKVKSALSCICFAIMAIFSTSAKAFEPVKLELTHDISSEAVYDEEASNYDGNYCYYTFTAPVSGTYLFYSTGSDDILCYLFNNSLNTCVYDDDSGDGRNFRFKYNLIKGETYYLGFYSYTGSPSYFNIKIKLPCEHANIKFVENESTATCISPTYTCSFYSCADCGANFADEACTEEIEVVSTYANHILDSNGNCSTCGTHIGDNYFAITAIDGDAELSIYETMYIPDLYFDHMINRYVISFYCDNYNPTFPDDYYFEYSFDKKNWTSMVAKHGYGIDGTKLCDYTYYDENGVTNLIFNEGVSLEPFQTALPVIPEGKTLYLRHAGKDITSMISDVSTGWILNNINHSSIELSGNVMSLLSADMTSAQVGDYAFYRFFEDSEPYKVNLNITANGLGKDCFKEIGNCHGSLYFHESTVNIAKREYEGSEENIKTIKALALNDNTFNISDVLDTDEDYSTISYTRNVKANWNTVCLPFDIRSTYYNKFYTIESFEDGVITLNETDKLAAGTPALMFTPNTGNITLYGCGVPETYVNNAAGTNRLVGTFAGTTVPGATDTDHIFYGLSANKGTYVKVSSDVELKPFRAYIECEKNAANEAGIRQSLANDVNTTAIEIISSLNSADTEYFGTNGQKQSGLQKGLNIIKIGDKTQKVIVK